MPIAKTTPVTVPTSIYDVWWCIKFHCECDIGINSSINVNPDAGVAIVPTTRPGTAFAVYRLSRIDADGNVIYYRNENNAFVDKQLIVPDLFAFTASDPGAASLLNTVVNGLGAIAKAQGIID